MKGEDLVLTSTDLIVRKNRISNSNSLFLIRVNFLLALLIVWHHVYNVETFNLMGNNTIFAKGLLYLENFFSIFQMVAVPTFLIISGYLFFINYSWDKVREKYKTRFKSLLVPYLVWNTIVFLFFFVLTHISGFKEYINKPEVELSWHSIYRNIIFCDLNFSMWFIRALIVIVAFSPILFFFLNKSKTVGWIIVILSFIAYAFFPVGQHTALFSLPFFLFGGLLGKYYHEILFLQVKRKTSIIAFVLLVLVIAVFVEGNVFDYPRIRPILLFLEVCIFWIVIRRMKYFSSSAEPPWLFRITFFIFCLHGIVLESVEKLIYIIGGNNVTCAYIDYFFAPVISIGLIFIIAKILHSKCNLIWNVLNGYR